MKSSKILLIHTSTNYRIFFKCILKMFRFAQNNVESVKDYAIRISNMKVIAIAKQVIYVK